MARFERDDIEAAVDGLIAMLDQRDGDADSEDDERSAAIMGELARDRDYADEPLPPTDGHAGDPIDAEDEDMDHGAEEDVDGGDPSWTEWHNRTGSKRRGHGPEPTGGFYEDAEDDDADACTAGDDGCGLLIAGDRAFWGSDLEDSDYEAWDQPATLERRIAANDDRRAA